LAGLRRGGKEWRGTPPKHAVVVLSTRLDAKPLPTVTLGDCPIAASSWAEYLVAKGSKISTSPARPAHRTSVEVVQRSGHWLVSHIATDPKHVCR
jgi:hypothetical protein